MRSSLSLAVAVALASASMACDHQYCARNSDCASGLACSRQGLCEVPLMLEDAGADGGSDNVDAAVDASIDASIDAAPPDSSVDAASAVDGGP
jgi:hypothetical protein